ncbi:hypothetical protein EYF80_026876 [Liparis tanakae]|uniref:Uncharacterized protein n=1 Tax=Liparis tanakae TaxID=230148 RepID=A0A4Z2HDF5_9TELE|nr:hypothetical protein EYF80_026876 [Liparis tanakae]
MGRLVVLNPEAQRGLRCVTAELLSLREVFPLEKQQHSTSWEDGIPAGPKSLRGPVILDVRRESQLPATIRRQCRRVPECEVTAERTAQT